MLELLLLSTAPLALAVSASGTDELADQSPAPAQAETTPAKKAPVQELFSTGVAKGRDRLDSATSTSALRASEIDKLGALSVGEVIRNIPGIRVEPVGEGANYTIRGLPMVDAGAKWLQFQEDGLPVLEFGDIRLLTPDAIMRVDLSLNQIETIRGGSASTFASNAPGGVVNFISKTGEVNGGAFQVSSGINYDRKRVDFTYGGDLGGGWRFQVGGFYREGEGQRNIGYTGFRGGQVKLNITKTLPNGYIRVYGKYLDDRTPYYPVVPMQVTGNGANPKYRRIANLNPTRDTLLGPDTSSILSLDVNNRQDRFDVRDGINPVVKSIGAEAQLDVAGWTVTERFRFSSIGGSANFNFPLLIGPAPFISAVVGAPGATFSFATGPNAGQTISNPLTLNGNGLISFDMFLQAKHRNADFVTNDLRASRVWSLGGGELTSTVGIYASRQTIAQDWTSRTTFSDVRGGNNAALIDLTLPSGLRLTDNGVFGYNANVLASYDVDYTTLAPYASLNYRIGKLSLGGSIRFDRGDAEGVAFGTALGSTVLSRRPNDVDGNGVLTFAESLAGFLDRARPSRVDYKYSYTSFSLSANYRVSEHFAAFGRYSRGGRGEADRILLSTAIDPVTGRLIDGDGYDQVSQAELGLKYRRDGLTLNLTGFLANTKERNSQVRTDATGQASVVLLDRDYRAYGFEFEGGYQIGNFSVAAGATYTEAEIRRDSTGANVIGNTPRRQPRLIFQATPQYSTELFTVGANVVGVTESYSQDSNELKMPGYTVVNGFVQLRPLDRVTLMLNVNNVFDEVGLVEVSPGSFPATGIAPVRTIEPRTVTAAVRFNF